MSYSLLPNVWLADQCHLMEFRVTSWVLVEIVMHVRSVSLFKAIESGMYVFSAPLFSEHGDSSRSTNVITIRYKEFIFLVRLTLKSAYVLHHTLPQAP